jgi:hypothetical protein
MITSLLRAGTTDRTIRHSMENNNERCNMTTIRIANAPCSWGTLEFAGLDGEHNRIGEHLPTTRSVFHQRLGERAGIGS